MSRIPFVLALLLPLLFGMPASAELRVADAWLREPPPVDLPAAAYLSITNAGATTLRITGIACDAYARVEWHATRMEDGVARMRRSEAPEIPPGETVRLAPGGMHLMLFDATRAVTAGDEVLLTLSTDDGASTEVRAPVRRGDAASEQAHHHHHHH